MPSRSNVVVFAAGTSENWGWYYRDDKMWMQSPNVRRRIVRSVHNFSSQFGDVWSWHPWACGILKMCWQRPWMACCVQSKRQVQLKSYSPSRLFWYQCWLKTTKCVSELYDAIVAFRNACSAVYKREAWSQPFLRIVVCVSRMLLFDRLKVLLLTQGLLLPPP